MVGGATVMVSDTAVTFGLHIEAVAQITTTVTDPEPCLIRTMVAIHNLAAAIVVTRNFEASTVDSLVRFYNKIIRITGIAYCCGCP